MAARTRQHADDDLSLMQRVASGDEQAVEQLYDRFGSVLQAGRDATAPSDGTKTRIAPEISPGAVSLPWRIRLTNAS